MLLAGIGLLLPPKAKDIYSALLFGFALALYIQGNFISTDYGTLDGDSIDWSQYTGTALWNTALWLICIITPMICTCIKPKIGKAILTYGSLILIAIQIIAVGILGFTTKAPESDMTLTYNSAFELSQNENTIVFILDAYDSAVFSDFIDTHPEYCDTLLRDFVYYPDTVGGATRTEFALPYILTGLHYQEGESYKEYINRGFSDTALYSALREQNYTIGLYTNSQYVSSSEIGTVVNLEENNMKVGSYPILTYYLYRFAAFRYFPHLLKEHVWMYSGDFNLAAEADVTEDSSYTIDDVRFYTALSEQQLSAEQEKNAFRLYHLMGAHAPYTLNALAERVSEGTSQDEQLQGLMTILETYFSQMKALGIYDNANIIIMADHGNTGVEQNPLFLLKCGNKITEYTVNPLPVSYANLHPTLLSLIGADTDEKTIFDLTENDNQSRYFYQKIGENNQLFLREYAVEGFAGDPASVRSTGVEIPLYGSDATDGSSYILGTELYFDNRATALPYMKSGFSSNEPTHTWADSDRSVLAIPFEEPPNGDLIADFSLYSLIQTPQRVSVYINDVLLGHYRIDGKKLCFIIPQELIAEDGILTIQFAYWDAMRPSDRVPGGDGRLLSIAFISMVIDQADRVNGEIHETPTFELPEGEHIDFSSDGNSEGCLGSGWWNQEETGRWTSENAYVTLHVADGQYDFLDLQFYSYPHSGDTRVLVNGQEVAVLENNPDPHTARIPLGGFLEEDIQEITFETPGATSPQAVGASTDDRALGIFVYSMQLGVDEENN